MTTHTMSGWDADWDGWSRFAALVPPRLLEAARQAVLGDATGEACRPRDRHNRMHGEPGHDRGHHGPGPRERGGRGGGRGPGRGGPDSPFGPGGWPFGRGFPPGPGFGRGARVARGDVREALLALLAEEPMHGYQMIGELTSRSGGAWRPSPGSVYPVLSLLADEGLVRAEERDGRRVFHLTETGRAHVEARAGAPRPWETAAANADDDTTALRGLALGLGAAVVQVAQAGDAGQIAAARELLTEARRGLYRILAGDLERPTTTPTSDGAGAKAAGNARGSEGGGNAGGGGSAGGATRP